MPPPIVRQGVNIVIRGQFNPAIFHPAWFQAQKLVRSQEADAAKIEVIQQDVAIFTMEWLQFRIVGDRFQVGTTQEAFYEPLRDLVIGVLDILNHTPLRVMGLNRDFHFRLESEKAWHAVGHRLAPKEDWQGALIDPGLMSLTMQGKRPDLSPGYIQVKVEPSSQIQYGVYIETNDHYELHSASETTAPPGEAVKILSEQWAASMSRSLEIANKIASIGATQ